MLSLRKIEVKDAKILFNWANDEQTRLNSINSNQIEWTEHIKWLEDKLKNTEHNFLFMITKADKNTEIPLAFVRFELKEKWITSIVISPHFRGQGLASKCLSLGILNFREFIKEPVYAYIKENNISSIKVFLKNNYILVRNKNKSLYKRID